MQATKPSKRKRCLSVGAVGLLAFALAGPGGLLGASEARGQDQVESVVESLEGITVNDLMHSVTLKAGVGAGSGSIRAKSTPDMPPGIDERGSSSTSTGFCGSMGADLPLGPMFLGTTVPQFGPHLAPIFSLDAELCDREPSAKLGGARNHPLDVSAKSRAAIDLTFGTRIVFEGVPSGVPLVPVAQLPLVFDAGVGPTFVRSTVKAVSDQRDFGGERETASKGEWLTGLAVKGGVSTPIGTVLGAPVLAGVETTFRFLPSQKVSVESSAFGFTERVKIDGRMENTTRFVIRMPLSSGGRPRMEVLTPR